MNKRQREQIRALAALNIPAGRAGGLSLANLVWRVENNPGAPLAWWERFRLDGLLWEYRENLKGAGVELPQQKPNRDEYRPQGDIGQGRLFS